MKRHSQAYPPGARAGPGAPRQRTAAARAGSPTGCAARPGRPAWPRAPRPAGGAPTSARGAPHAAPRRSAARRTGRPSSGPAPRRGRSQAGRVPAPAARTPRLVARRGKGERRGRQCRKLVAAPCVRRAGTRGGPGSWRRAPPRSRAGAGFALRRRSARAGRGASRAGRARHGGLPGQQVFSRAGLHHSHGISLDPPGGVLPRPQVIVNSCTLAEAGGAKAADEQ